MATSIERRASLAPALGSARQPDITSIVQQGILLRARLGTVGAVEFLKIHGIGSRILTRVLGGECMRDADREALQQVSLQTAN